MSKRRDIWRCGIVERALPDLLTYGLGGAAIHWLPEGPSFTFEADPFAIDVDGQRYLFVEYYDYRNRHGEIHALTLGPDFQITNRQLCLREPWHLSYPQVFMADGDIWMLPEANRSGKLTLYRAKSFPSQWERHCEISVDAVPVDATLLHWRDKWWMFYSPATSKQTKISQLHVAWADHFTGPWTPHPGNPIHKSHASCRPGGTPVVQGDDILMPMQDCTHTYGGMIQVLRITDLSETTFTAEDGDKVMPRADFAPYVDGLHTLTACGPVTMIDAKRIDRSLRGRFLDFRRELFGASARR